ncbi:small ribosomal subunit protein mS31 isoform X2 [Delphinus delphis]|uniref:Small ribosomal subunit protein mS31 n=1 Tax=Tursiops truncatus TaxID=9739 RepID=A0A2U4BGA2_TURTR|nr:28S ribosomal protein S31, mitochondrial isoform X2 [Tursiops truncatus]XP_059852085.1 small ribosomal subunit protein mS31 isoform X2 [Delphinus delphis]
MFPRVSALLPLRPLSRLPLCSGDPEVSAAAVVLLASPHGSVRTKNNIQRYFGTNSVIYSKKDEQPVPAREISKETESQHSVKENTKKDLVNILKGMKVELSSVNVQTTKPPNRRQLKSLEASTVRLQSAPEDAPQKSESLSPELVAAASAVADSLPFDKQMTKSDLLKQLQQHEEASRAQKDGERPKISFTDIISDMKVARSATARVSTRPVHQIQFDEGTDDFVGQAKPADLRRSFRKNIFKGKRLNIFELKAVTEEAPETEAVPSLWDVEFAKQLAAVNEQPFQNGFEEMIQLTKEGKLWEFPINNEAGFDDDGSEFHEHIFLDKYLEDFPKQGPIRHFMELVTCGLSKNPYLSVKQKVEHIEWFRNYFNEKRDILKESGIQFN